MDVFSYLKSMETTEIWKPVVGYEGLYEVSSHGRIKALSKMVLKRSGVRAPLKERILSPKISTNKYLRITLTKNKKSRAIYLHRIIAEAFIPNPDNKPQVNHINGKKLDNEIENLEWVSLSENVNHAFANGLIPRVGAKRMRSILQYDLSGKLVMIHKSTRSAAKKLGLSHSTIMEYCKKSNNAYLGHRWKYGDFSAKSNARIGVK